MSRERFGTIDVRKEDGRFSSYLDENDDKNNELISRNTINIVIKKEDKKKKLKKDKEKKDKKKKGLGLHFFHLKKEKPVKVEDKNAKEEQEKENEIQENFRQIQALKKETNITPEEVILNYVQDIIMLFSFEEPNKRDLTKAKKNLDFYKDINKKMAEAIGKPPEEKKTIKW